MARTPRMDGQQEGQEDMNVETPTKEEKSLERKAAAAEKTALEQLRNMPKKTLYIPMDPTNPDDKLAIVGFNGIIYSIPRDQEVEVPEEIYNIWKDSEKRTREVTRRIEKSTQQEVRVM